jgi:hypothetical protein
MITTNLEIILAIKIFILEIILFSPNIVYFLHKKHFNWKSKKENLALTVLINVYTQGDNYHFGENNKIWWASFSNDYPLQHGKGWTLVIEKNTYEFNTTGNGKNYHDKIKKIIKWKT